MGTRIAVHVHARDSITRFGLTAQVNQTAELMAVEQIGPGTVVLVAVDTLAEDTLRWMRDLHRRGAVTFVLVTADIDDAALHAAVEVGVSGLIDRAEVTPSKIEHTVVKAAQGEAALPAVMLTRLLRQVSARRSEYGSQRSSAFTGLTSRESQVLRLVADGLDTDEIAVQLSYSARTVKNILHGVTSRFCLRNRSHAVAYAMREGLI